MTKEALSSILGQDHVSDDPSVLDGYLGDGLFKSTEAPQYVVYPSNTDEVQAVVKLANEQGLALTPRSSAVSFNGGSLPLKGGIVVDLGRMNRILEVDTFERKVKIEPGVTWGQLQAELKKENLMVSGPLLPHADRSVLTSSLQREPMAIPKSEYDETFLTGEVVLGTGDLFWTGTALAKGMNGQANPEAFLLGTRVFYNQQGTFGIFTWANVKAEIIPKQDKVYFIPCDTLEKTIDPVYRIQRLMMGNECFVLNNVSLASILAASTGESFEDLKRNLPPYTIVQVLSGLKRRPEEQIAYQEEALLNLASELGFNAFTQLEALADADKKIVGLLRGPWPEENYWKNNPRDNSLQIRFHTQLRKTTDFSQQMDKLADENGYSANDIGVYIQPIERARLCQVEFNLPYDSNNEETPRKLYDAMGEAVIGMGGIVTNPSGSWKEMTFKKVESNISMMDAVKQTFDPNGIMSPGNLYFSER